jgi:RNA polymerase sigma-70 factor, ECF subfamily
MAPDDAMRGDTKDFMTLIGPLLPAAHRLAFGLLRSRADAEDAVQEGALKAWRHFGRFRRGSDVKPWLFAIVANECRHRQRSRWSSVSELPDTLEDPASDPAGNIESTDLRRALYLLPYERRLAVVLRYYVDLSFEEVGQTMGVSTKAAKSRTYRALDSLRLNPEVPHDE